MLNDYPDVLTPKQLSEILGIGRNSTYELLNNHDIGSIKVGKKFLIPKICVLDYFNSARFGIQDDNSRQLSEGRTK